MTVTSEPVSDTKFDTASLAVISFKGLLEKDENELLKLFKAAVSPGFFYVDVRDSEQHVADIKEMATICARYFKQPEVVKMRDFVKGHEFSGWVKPRSRSLFIVFRPAELLTFCACCT